MKILLISNFEQVSGYSYAAQELAHCMFHSGLDIYCRSIKLSSQHNPPSEIVQQLMGKTLDKPDVVIQLTLPTLFDYYGPAKNILYFCFENQNLPLNWIMKLRQPDEIWVPNKGMAKILKSLLHKKPIQIIPFATDINRYTRNFMGKGYIGQLKNQFFPKHLFSFYTIGEFTSRKNWEALLRAYFSTFSPYESVALIIKTSKDNHSPEDVKLTFNELILHVRKQMKLDKLPQVHVITENYAESEIDRLHYEGDCFVSTSHGESWNIPAFNALGFGKTPIVSNVNGHSYIMAQNGFLVDGSIVPCHGAIDTLDELSNGYQSWLDVNISDFGDIMRGVYTNRDGCCSRKRKYGLETVQKYSYDKVGQIIKKTLQISNPEDINVGITEINNTIINNTATNEPENQTDNNP